MDKKIVGILLVVGLLAVGAGYAVSQPQDPNPTTEASDVESSGETLDLTGQQFTSIPESVLNRTNLTTLDLSNNQLATLPAGIAKLTNLQVLNVENNRLETLPTEISQLTSLREIRANNNRMTSLPTELGNMRGLTLLDVSGNSVPTSQIQSLKAKLTNTEVKS